MPERNPLRSNAIHHRADRLLSDFESYEPLFVEGGKAAPYFQIYFVQNPRAVDSQTGEGSFQCLSDLVVNKRGKLWPSKSAVAIWEIREGRPYQKYIFYKDKSLDKDSKQLQGTQLIEAVSELAVLAKRLKEESMPMWEAEREIERAQRVLASQSQS